MTAERDALRGMVRDAKDVALEVERERDEARAQLAAANERVTELEAQMGELTKTSVLSRKALYEHAERAEADAAAMRESAQAAVDMLEIDAAPNAMHELEDALSGDAGRALLAERDRLREEVAEVTHRSDVHWRIAEHEKALANTAQAALGRAHAAINQLQEDLIAGAECDFSILADAEGRAAGEMLAALEAEHEAWSRIGDNGVDAKQAIEAHEAAHAAVEALRGKGAR